MSGPCCEGALEAPGYQREAVHQQEADMGWRSQGGGKEYAPEINLGFYCYLCALSS